MYLKRGTKLVTGLKIVKPQKRIMFLKEYKRKAILPRFLNCKTLHIKFENKTRKTKWQKNYNKLQTLQMLITDTYHTLNKKKYDKNHNIKSQINY